MYLVKNPNSPFYQVVYFVDSKRKSKSTKQKLKSEANKFLTQFEKELKKCSVIKRVNLEEFELEYLQFIRIHSIAYQKIVISSFKQLKEYLGKDANLLKIDNRILEKYIFAVYSRSESAASLYYRTLKAAFAKAVVWNYILENPFLRVPPPKVKSRFPVFVKPQDMNLLLPLVKEDYLKSFYIIAFNTGMRANEICNLRWNAIDLSQRIITVKNTNTFSTKSRKERIIPINEKVYLELLKRKTKVVKINSVNDDFVFYRIFGVKLLVDFVSKKFKKACRATKVSEDMHLHSLRHGFASQLVQKGVSLYVVKEILGHSDLKTTQIYSHLQKEDLQNAVNLI